MPSSNLEQLWAILPNPSARAEWLVAGPIDKALSHYVRAPPLDAGGDDEDADTGTDTATSDDDSGDIASLHLSTIHITAALKLPVVPARPFELLAL